jgi:hypothetical protein
MKAASVQTILSMRTHPMSRVIPFATNMTRAVAACAIATALGAMTPRVCVGAESRVALTVRFYNTSGVSAPELLAARRAFESIYTDTGIDVRFRQCGRPVSAGGPVDKCSESLKPRELVVRVINAPPFNPHLHPEAYGMAYIVKETDRGWLATVFSDRIGGAASRVGVTSGTLLGLVIAHEVGHLLLGSAYHGWTGIMRAGWPDTLLNHPGNEWRFSRLEAARLRQAASINF